MTTTDKIIVSLYGMAEMSGIMVQEMGRCNATDLDNTGLPAATAFAQVVWVALWD